MNKPNDIIYNGSICQSLLWSSLEEDVYFEISNGIIKLMIKKLDAISKLMRVPSNNLNSILSRKHKFLLVSNNINRTYNEEEK